MAKNKKVSSIHDPLDREEIREHFLAMCEKLRIETLRFVYGGALVCYFFEALSKMIPAATPKDLKALKSKGRKNSHSYKAPHPVKSLRAHSSVG